MRIFAHLAVEQIDQLFAIERQIKDGKLSEPLAYRREHATPILAAIKASLEAKLPGLAAKTPTASAEWHEAGCSMCIAMYWASV